LRYVTDATTPGMVRHPAGMDQGVNLPARGRKQYRYRQCVSQGNRR
jgi:hypothetical protein